MQQATGSAVNFFVYGGIILMPAKLTQEEFVRKAHEINPNLEILSKYKGRTKKGFETLFGLWRCERTNSRKYFNWRRMQSLCNGKIKEIAS